MDIMDIYNPDQITLKDAVRFSLDADATGKLSYPTDWFWPITTVDTMPSNKYSSVEHDYLTDDSGQKLPGKNFLPLDWPSNS